MKRTIITGETEGPATMRWFAQWAQHEGEPIAAFGKTEEDAILDLIQNYDLPQ